MADQTYIDPQDAEKLLRYLLREAMDAGVLGVVAARCDVPERLLREFATPVDATTAVKLLKRVEIAAQFDPVYMLDKTLIADVRAYLAGFEPMVSQIPLLEDDVHSRDFGVDNVSHPFTEG